MHDTESERLKPWQVLGRDLLLERKPWLSVHQERVELPSGRILNDFYRVVLPDFAAAVPVTASGEVVMVRGYKHGLGRVTLSPPAGLLDAGEPPLEAARRELLEETGYAAKEWQKLGTFVVDGNRQCGTMHLFLATGAYRVVEPKADDTEQLQVELLRPERLIEALRTGEIGNLAGAAAAALAIVLGMSGTIGQLRVA